VPLSIDVVVPTYRKWEFTERCLEHLGRQTVPSTVYVVEDSADGVPDALQGRFPSVRFIELRANRGFSVACNAGIGAGSGEIIAVLNNDAFVRPDFLERLAEPFERDPRVGSVAAVSLREDERTVDEFGLTIDATLACHPVARGRPLAEVQHGAFVVAGPCGGVDSYRRAAFEQVGGYDERLVMYFADVDLAVRLAAAGWLPATAPEAIAVHLRSSTLGHRSPKARQMTSFARGYMIRRYGLLGRRVGPRVVATEAVAVLGDALLSHDLVGVQGRVRGWRAAAGLPRRMLPPDSVVDGSIGFLRGLALRWANR
jgi:N-acetylglucosaminyl-diphospho-decaprenol L-rhamnosyltransferase